MMVPDYEVCQELSRNEWFLLYRGRLREDGRSVLLKMPSRDPASPFEVRLLEHEYTILQGLSLSGVIRVHELVRYDQGCGLVLEDRGGTPLQALLASRRLDLDSFFKLAIQLATILAELHRRETIHKHLNPYSILLHPTPVKSASPTSAWRHGRSAKHKRRFPSRSCIAHSHICHQSRLAG